MDIAITGTSGFIGNYLYKHLSHKHNVWPIFTKSIKRMELLNNFETKLKFDLLICCGWSMGSNNEFLNDFGQLENIKDHINLFNFAIQTHVKRMIFFGSSWQLSRYGENLYQFSKNKVSEILKELCRINYIKYDLVVPYWLYGPKDKENRFIPKIIKSCLENRKVELHPAQNFVDYLFISDAINALNLIIERENKIEDIFYNHYNICSGQGYKIKDIVEKIKELTNSKSEITYNKDYPPNFNMEWIGDNEKLVKLGWYPRIGISEGLERTIEWQKTK